MVHFDSFAKMAPHDFLQYLSDISSGSETIIYAAYSKTYATENTVCREILFDTLLQ